MVTRLIGLGLIAVGIIAGVFSLYLPLRDGGDGYLGRTRVSALVFVPLCVVTGLAFAIGGPPALAAFQARNKSQMQMALVLSVIVGAGVMSGVGYWQIKSRRDRSTAPVILSAPPAPPSVSQPAFVPPPR